MKKKIYASLIAVAILSVAAASARAQDWDSAISLFNQKQYRQAAKAFHGVLKTNPDFWQAWYYIGVSHYNLHSYEDTIDAFQNYIKGAEKDEKGQAAGYYYTGFSHYQLKHYDQAIPALTKYLSLSEKLKEKVEPTTRAALGRAYIFTEKYSEAIPVLMASNAEIKTNANNYYYIGYAHQKLGHTDQAIAALNQGLAIDAKDVDILTLLGDLYLAQGNQNPQAFKQAIATGEKLLAIKNDETTWVLLGQAYLLDKQYAKAAPFLDKYARAHLDASSAWINLGIAYSRSSQWKPAATALEQAAKLAPANVGVLLELGYVYESDKLPEKALSAYQRAFDASGKKDETARQSLERLKSPAQPQTTNTQPQPTAKKPVSKPRAGRT
ncbi:MAG: tetratricopeptide repeat protein [Acidobacteria bacterium]|nr:tetratricopeptide repeat protein [Acidobacteriota bacterium]